MEDPLGVQVGQGLHHLLRAPEDRVPFRPLLKGAQPVKGAPLHQLHDKEGTPLLLPQVQDLDDAGVEEAGEGPDLQEEALPLGREGPGVEELHRHLPPQALVHRPPDLGHAPGAQGAPRR